MRAESGGWELAAEARKRRVEVKVIMKYDDIL